MHKGKKTLVVLMTILIIALTSCATEKPAPKPEPQPEVTTTTTLPAPIPEPTPVTTTTLAVPVTTTVAQPSVSEIELRNLFGQANALKMEADQYNMVSVMPATYNATDADFKAAKAAYDAAMDDVSFDGVKSYPVKEKLENSIAMWEYLLDQGMPIRVQEESDKATDMKFAAMSAEAPDLASDRFQGADELFTEAQSLADGKEYAMAIPAFQQAAAAYDVAAEKAKANKLREKIFANGYAKYADSNFQIAEQKYAAEESLWASRSLEDLKAGADSLREANSYYEFVISTGAEYKSFEGKDRALQAQDKALSIKADVNAADEYNSASDILSEALDNQANGNYESAFLWFGDAAEAFDNAYDSSMTLQSADEDAIAAAETAVKASTQKYEASGLENNVYLPEANSFLDKAKSQYADKFFSDSTVNANEAANYAGLSDTYVDSELQRIADANAKALQEAQAKLAADKAAADPAMADARTRMAWAENNSINADYPTEYKDASTSMKAAEISYSNERYVPAKSLAVDVSTVLSDGFQTKVLADRKAIADEKARQAELAAAKAVARSNADTAMADAQNRMAWANENGIKADYPDEYGAASSAMVGSFVSYGNEDYANATVKANEVSSILSNDFQGKVAADRKAAQDAAAQLAADKAAADPAMADARTRMAWAENNNIGVDYPKQYKDASTSMKASEISYSNERYVSAKSLAEDVSATLSDDFQKKVLADRAPKPVVVEPAPVVVEPAPVAVEPAPVAVEPAPQPVVVEPAPQPVVVQQGPSAEELAAAKAAAKASAQADIDKAQAKYDWAISKNAQNNFPEQLAKGSAELNGAKVAFSSEDFAGASSKALAAFATLSDIGEFAPLPAVYVVRLIPARRDCLWRIAEYSFIYNNPLKWPVLYEANKKTFKDPSNPNLIFPNQVLQIPSIKGETRSGTWDPKKTYNPLPKK
ncbi:MAG: LysM peptidoglycan-binding domain-containing protein [Spirochaetales bacterium]